MAGAGRIAACVLICGTLGGCGAAEAPPPGPTAPAPPTTPAPTPPPPPAPEPPPQNVAPPLPPDPPQLEALANARRTDEFAASPGLAEMNAHWAYARGLTGAGESIGMTDSGLYAAHEEFAGRLHPETRYTVIADGDGDPNAPGYSYFTVAERAPATAYPPVQADTSPRCLDSGGRNCKFLDYGHGTSMASAAAAARNGRHAHGMAFDASLLFWPDTEWDSGRGFTWYHGPWGGPIHGESRHDRVRHVGDRVPVVSNSWLTGDSRFHLYLPDEILAEGGYFPFYSALGPRYAAWQSDRDPADRTILVWSAGNRPITGGPLVDGAVLPSLTERQVRAATGGETGLADVLLSPDARRGLSAEQAQLRAEAVVSRWKRQWLTTVAVVDSEDLTYDRENLARLADCAAGRRTGAACAVDYLMGDSARCGFASDWCVAVGSTYGSVGPLADRPPDPTGHFWLTTYQTSPAAATAGAALGVLLQGYRGPGGALTAGTDSVLARLKFTANAGIFNTRSAQDRNGRHLVDHEEEQIRALVSVAGATDAELSALIRTARSEFAQTLAGVPLTQEEDAAGRRTENPFSPADAAAIAAARDGFSEGQWTRYHLLNRVAEYYTLFWRTIDPFPPQLARVKRLLADSDPARGRAGPERDLLARLIRQVEWIDGQLRRLGRTKTTVTDAEVRRLTITSMIGHGLIDLKAATDPAR